MSLLPTALMQVNSCIFEVGKLGIVKANAHLQHAPRMCVLASIMPSSPASQMQ